MTISPSSLYAVKMKRIYLDNNATTPLDVAVLDAMIEELAASPHNPSSFHSYGEEGKRILSDARQTIANHLGVRRGEILFTSGGTEGMNLLIRGALAGKKGSVIGCPIDHACALETLRNLEGFELIFLPVNSYGAPHPSSLEKTLRPDTRLIVLSAANGETGVKLDISSFAQIARENGIPLILDGVQLLGKEPFVIPEGVSGMAFSAHKFHGPQGVGFVFCRSGFKLSPLITGGGQEKNLRSGTENLPGIVGMTRAITLLDEAPPIHKLKALRERFEGALIEAFPEIEINGEGPRLPNTSNLYFPGVDGESLLIALDMQGIAASHASACASGALEPSRVLLNMGYSRERAASSLRFSFSRLNTPEEIDQAALTIIALEKKQKSFAIN